MEKEYAFDQTIVNLTRLVDSGCCCRPVRVHSGVLRFEFSR